MVTISIIVPVYNARDRLIPCLDSIRSQVMRDYECILVDDGSTDGSAHLLDDYAKKDSRFRVIHQRNSGVGRARNTGLEAAGGTYITFVDSDDTIAPGYLENMLHQIGDRDLLISGFTMCRGEQRESIGLVTGDPSVENMAAAMQAGLLNSCWGKLYRTELFRDLRFSEAILWGEDTAYLMLCLCRTKRIVFAPLYDYFYTYSTTGLAKRFDIRHPEYLQVYYEYLRAFLDQWAQKNDPLYCETARKISQEILRSVNDLLGRQLTRQEERNYLRTLFSNPSVNRLFADGVSFDDNPVVVKLLSRFPKESVWKVYLNIRRWRHGGRQ